MSSNSIPKHQKGCVHIDSMNIGTFLYFLYLIQFPAYVMTFPTKNLNINFTASEASSVYILGGQKFNKNAKNGPFWRVFENLKFAVTQCYQTGQF